MITRSLFFALYLHTLFSNCFSFYVIVSDARSSQRSHVITSKVLTDIYYPTQSFRAKTPIHSSTLLLSKDETNEEEVKLGSKDYYSGFVSRGLNEDSEERVTGDAVLIPTLKFVGGFSVAIGVLLIGFLASNGLL